MINIWINRAGPSRIHAMRMLRENSDGTSVKIFATRTNRHNPSLAFCDVPGLEPGGEVSDEEYGQFAVDFVARHGIRVVIPTSRMAALAAREMDLALLGCVVMAPDEAAARIADSKTDTYRHARTLGVPVPTHFCVNDSVEFRDAVFALRREGYTACVKPDTGWAASSFRIIADDPPTLDTLMKSSKPVMDMESYATVLVKADRAGRDIPPLIVMPYLDEPECSVDMVSSPEGVPYLSVIRRKSGWYREFVEDEKITNIAHRMAEGLGLSYLTNVQVRYLDGAPVLLEVNPRPSAGTFHTEAAGVNLYWEAVKVALGRSDIARHANTGGRVLITESSMVMPS